MATEEFDEESIDTEALQAQIDLSMSYAQSLIDSWLPTTKPVTNSRRNDLEKELQESMKRPARLGVGATPAEGMQSLTRQTARLKGKLAGSKRAHEEAEEKSTTSALLEEEDESRAGAITKKARLDPFDVVHGKKKKKTRNEELSLVKSEEAAGAKTVVSIPDPAKSPLPPVMDHLAVGGESSPTRKKRKKRKVLQDELPADTLQDQKALSEAAVQDRQRVAPGSSQATECVGSTPNSPNGRNSTTTTLSSTELRSPDVVAAHLLGYPLLNLSGPPPSDIESDVPGQSPTTSPKKKRKRKKKKKHHTTAETEGAGPTEASSTVS